MIRIQVPATSANLGSGFDSLGIALSMYNQVWMEEADGIFINSRDGMEVPADENNLIYWSAKLLYQECGKKLPGLRIEQQSDIPMARGLGSSSACIVAGLTGANRFLGNPLTMQDLVNLACRIEGHPDNTTPALTGGLVASAMEAGRVHSVTVPVSDLIQFAVLIPPFELKTEFARGVLPDSYSREDAVYNLSRSALMTAALFSGSLSNLRVAVQDRLHQPYRQEFIPGIETVFRLSYELGSFGAYISGAGPSIISIVDDAGAANFQRYALSHLEEKNISGWKLELLHTDSAGAAVYID
ncbi:MAG: homoserine kinase [Clostridiales bacterium]|jgi:homoserine kinase|nr:homoserine kinase [Clostridiales bacterium]